MRAWHVQGSGIKPGTRPRTCSSCNGQGVVMQVVRTPLGMLQQQSACPQCQGTGEIVDEYCGTCSGRGRVQKNKQLKITIPAGVDNGSRCILFVLFCLYLKTKFCIICFVFIVCVVLFLFFCLSVFCFHPPRFTVCPLQIFPTCY